MDWRLLIAGITGITVLGEALALVVGMHVLSEADNPWSNRKNNLLLASDLLAASLMLWMIFSQESVLQRSLLTSCLIILLLSHAFRTLEYLAKWQKPFCANLPLFIVNLVKFAGLLLTAGFVWIHPGGLSSIITFHVEAI